MKKKLVSVVTTFRNEEKTLDLFLERVTGILVQLDQYDYEIIFVDDASTDHSLKILRKRAEQSGGLIKVLVTSRRFGVYPCLMACLEHASGEAVIYLETDLQDPPELISSLIREWERGADVVYTTRTKRLGEGSIKMLLTKFAYRFVNWLSEVPIPLDSGDFKLMSKRVVNELLKLKEPDPYFRGMVSWVGFRQVQVFYERAGRIHGKSKRSLWTSAPLKVFLSAVLSFSKKPLYAISLVGLIYLVVSGFVICDLVTGSGFFGRVTLFLIFAVSISLILLSLGIQSLYLARLCSEVKRRPLYLIREKIGFDE